MKDPDDYYIYYPELKKRWELLKLAVGNRVIPFLTPVANWLMRLIIKIDGIWK